MTRLELLKIVVGQAHANGFDFKRWYKTRLSLPWINADAAFTMLDAQRRYYALLFSHEFAGSFWKAGSDITFQVASQTFQRVMPDGSVTTVTRKPFTRRSARRDVWRYHLREMAVAEDPLRYIRKYLHVEEELDEDAPKAPQEASETAAKGTAVKKSATKRAPRALPKDLPAFLRRPYP